MLADEINRTTPKSQSALLEAMEERQVTIDGNTRPLPTPFFVIATQNPNTQAGTFPLSESQLDRFLMRIELGYPDAAAEEELLKGEDRRALLDRLSSTMDVRQLEEYQESAQQVKVSEALLDYIQRLVQYSRQGPEFAASMKIVIDAYVEMNYMQEQPNRSDKLRRAIRAFRLKAFTVNV